jgi:hypothetical protein
VFIKTEERSHDHGANRIAGHLHRPMRSRRTSDRLTRKSSVAIKARLILESI